MRLLLKEALKFQFQVNGVYEISTIDAYIFDKALCGSIEAEIEWCEL